MQPNAEKPEYGKLQGFDFLRAVFAIAIVALHSDLFFLVENIKISYLSLTDVLEADFAYLAVPVFFQISLFLFCLKREEVGSGYLRQKRLPKLISLYLFWVISKIIFDILLNGQYAALQNGISSPRMFIEFIVSGGNSPLYFFFSLAFVTILAEVTMALLERVRKLEAKIVALHFLLLLSVGLISFFSALRSTIFNLNIDSLGLIQFFSSLAQWDYNPLNFLPYIFTAAISATEFKAIRLHSLGSKFNYYKSYILISLFVVFTLLEWSFNRGLLHYSRPSLIFGSWVLLYLSFSFSRRVPKIIQLISSCSLGIYTLHLFFTHGLFANESNVLSLVFHGSPYLAILANFTISLVFSLLLTFLFKKINFLKGFV